MLFRARTAPGSGHYIEQIVFKFVDFDFSAMQQAVNELISRRRALRSFFMWREQEQALLVSLKSVSIEIESDNTHSLEELLKIDREQGFALDKAPLTRMRISSFDNSCVYCIWTLHHAIVDGWSIVLLQNELLTLYGEYKNNKLVPASANEMLQNTPEIDDSEFWRSKLEHVPNHHNLDFLHRDVVNTQGYDEFESMLSIDESNLVNTWCKQARITFSSFVHCAWALLLMQITAREDFLIASIDSGRGSLEKGEALVGLFMKLMPIRVVLNKQQTLADTVKSFQKNYWTLQGINPPSPDKLARMLGRQIDEPLFDSIVAVQNYPRVLTANDLGLVSIQGYEQADAPLVLSIGAETRIKLLYRFQTNHFDKSSLSMLDDTFRSMLILIATLDENTPLKTVLKYFESKTSKTIIGSPAKKGPNCLQVFLSHASRTPNATALFGSSPVSYAKLQSMAEALRLKLEDLQIQSGDVVGIHLPRSEPAIAAMLAVQAMDAIFLPLDPSYPKKLLEYMLGDSDAVAVIGNFTTNFGVPVIEPENCSEPATLQQVTEYDCDSMCLIYTSGSTAQPKGVYITHESVANRLLWMRDRYPLAEGEVCCHRTPLSFVDSISEIFFPLSSGIPLLIISNDTVNKVQLFLQTLEKYKITRLVVTPSILEALLEVIEASNIELPHLKLCTVSGESLSVAVANLFFQFFPHSRLLNLYGSTEVTADALYAEILPTSDSISQLPIGQPLSGTYAYIANEHGNKLPPGCVGELIIGGVCVCKGYRNQERLSADRFVEGEFKSGDLAYIDNNDQVFFKGRVDRQVKIRGQRVELEAVEHLLYTYRGIREARVIARNNILIALYVGEPIDPDRLSNYLAEHLPDYAVPKIIRNFERFPKLASGKTDFRKLAESIPTPASRQVEKAPLSLMENQLANTILGVWQGFFPDQIINRETHFFDVGGHSLLAMRMIARLERVLGTAIDISILIDNPVLSNFAKAICNRERSYKQSKLFKLRFANNATKRNLICIHGDAYNLVDFLSPGYSLYWISQWAIRLELMKHPSLLADEKLENTASQYIALIEKLDLTGPIELLASCGAAVVALEMAHQLEKLGRTPSRLVLMDLPRGELSGSIHKQLKYRHNRSWTKSAYGYLFRVFGGEALRKNRQLKEIEQKIQAGTSLSDLEARNYTDYKLFSALAAYKPVSYRGRVELVFSGRWRRGVDTVDDAKVPEFWRNLLCDVSAIHFSPAKNHEDLLGKEASRFLANEVLSNPDN